GRILGLAGLDPPGDECEPLIERAHLLMGQDPGTVERLHPCPAPLDVLLPETLVDREAPIEFIEGWRRAAGEAAAPEAMWLAATIPLAGGTGGDVEFLAHDFTLPGDAAPTGALPPGWRREASARAPPLPASEGRRGG